MGPEREFIHLIANQLASAKLSTELALEILGEQKNPAPEVLESLNTALFALGKMESAVDAARTKLLAEEAD